VQFVGSYCIIILQCPAQKNVNIHFFVCGYAVHFNSRFSFCKHTKAGKWMKSVTTNLECGFLLFQFLPKQAMSGRWSYIYILCGDVWQLSFCTSEFSFQSNSCIYSYGISDLLYNDKFWGNALNVPHTLYLLLISYKIHYKEVQNPPSSMQMKGSKGRMLHRNTNFLWEKQC